MFLTGVLQAIVVLIQCVFFNVFIRIVNLHYEINGILFACICGVAASFILLIYAGPGKLGASSMKNWATWGYGFCGLSQFALDIYLVQYISATELSLFSRLSIPSSIILAFILLRRKPAKQDIIAVLSIVLGSLILFYLQDSLTLQTVVIFVALIAIFRAGEFLCTEVHTDSVSANQNGNMKDRARVVGFASFASSLMFLTTCFIASIIKEVTSIDNGLISAFPNMIDYLHFPTIILGFLYGTFITAFARFCIWSATYKIKTENILAILVFVPILTYLSEISVSAFLGMEINSNMFAGERGQLVFVALVLMTLGSAISIIPKVLKNINRQKGQSWFVAFKESIKQQDNTYEIQHDVFDSSDNAILEQSLAFYDNDYTKVANLYEISEDAIRVILSSKGNSCFIEEVSKKVQKIYQENIVTKDKLTHARNRISLSIDIAEKINAKEDFSIALLDLNDFKPVNDTYGHEAGDVVLKEITIRLEKIFKNNVYRLGGDEFVIISVKKLTAARLKQIKNSIIQEIVYKDVLLKVGTSLGVAEYIKDGISEDDLLEAADKNLYVDKESKANAR